MRTVTRHRTMQTFIKEHKSHKKNLRHTRKFPDHKKKQKNMFDYSRFPYRREAGSEGEIRRRMTGSRWEAGGSSGTPDAGYRSRFGPTGS